MVEWLLTNSQITAWSLSGYITQFQHTVRRSLDDLVLWVLVILFIVILRWLTGPRNNVT